MSCLWPVNFFFVIKFLHSQIEPQKVLLHVAMKTVRITIATMKQKTTNKKAILFLQAGKRYGTFNNIFKKFSIKLFQFDMPLTVVTLCSIRCAIISLHNPSVKVKNWTKNNFILWPFLSSFFFVGWPFLHVVLGHCRVVWLTISLHQRNRRIFHCRRHVI